MPTNDFLAFAAEAGANVLSQAEYLALNTLRANGFVSGTAKSAELNKVWRQSSMMARVLAQFISDTTAADVLDNGDDSALVSALLSALRLVSRSNSGSYGNDTGSANAYTVAYAPAVSALSDGMVLRFRAKTANSGASTFSPNGLAAKPIVGLNKTVLQGGEITVNGNCAVVWSAAGDHWILLSSTGGALQIAAPSQSNHAVPFSWLPKRSFSVNDYIRIPDVPGGLIIQWGTLAGSPGQRTITYPIAFPAEALHVFMTPQASQTTTGTFNDNWVNSFGNSNATVYMTTNATLHWLAVGV